MKEIPKTEKYGRFRCLHMSLTDKDWIMVQSIQKKKLFYHPSGNTRLISTTETNMSQKIHPSPRRCGTVPVA
jgi:hypothetical protein